MRQCAICAGSARVLRRWLGGPHAVCAECRAAVAAWYAVQPVRRRGQAGVEAWGREEVERRLPRPANTGQQASGEGVEAA